MSTLCLRCLSRSIHDLQRPLSAAPTIARATFSTTSQLLATPPKKKGVVVAQKKGGLRLKKTIRAKPSGRPPAPGERKANRKKVVLSNTNALEVRGLQRLNKSNAKADSLKQAQGRILAFEDTSLDALRALQAFKSTQGWGLFRNASTLVRSDTVKLAQAVEQAETKATSIVLTGKRSSGKSVLQLQAMAIAQLRDWVVIHIPEAQDITIGYTAFQPALAKDGSRIYIQPQYTAKVLESILKANEQILAGMRLSKTHKLPIPIPDNISLARLADMGAKDHSISWPVFTAVMEELTAPTQEGEGLQRRPVMISVDGIGHIMKESEYLDPNLKKIHAHEFGIVATLVGYLNGASPMPNGGLFLGASSASSSSHSPVTPTLDFLFKDDIAKAEQKTRPTFDPYTKWDGLVEKALAGVAIYTVGGLSKEEARGAMEYYALSGIYRTSVTDKLVAEKWSVSGGGIVGELEKSCVRQRY